MTPFLSALVSFLARKAAAYAQELAMTSTRSRGTFAGTAIEIPVEPAEAIRAGYGPKTPCVFVMPTDLDPLRFVHESGTQYLISSGVSDGGSTPPILRGPCKEWADLQPFGKLKRAFFFHDGLYRDAGCFVRKDDASEWEWMRVTREMADLLFFQAMTACDGHNLETWGIYRAVALGAGFAWDSHRSRDSKPLSKI